MKKNETFQYSYSAKQQEKLECVAVLNEQWIAPKILRISEEFLKK